MEIKYLSELEKNPQINFKGSINILKPIPIAEITELERIFNNGNSFPTAIKELLYLAGQYCYVLDYGMEGSQLKMQNKARAWMKKNGRDYEITRPFFAIDVYGSADQFIFVYTDEYVADPILYEANLNSEVEDYDVPFMHSLNTTLSKYIERGIEKLKNGQNPF